jgi:ribonuclease HII
LTIGLDEAGRGPLLGPMVLAVVALRSRAAAALTRLGVADSKAFVGPDAHEVRSALVPHILCVADHVGLRVVDVEEIDAACEDNGLNRLEQRIGAELITAAPTAKRIVADGQRLFSPLRARFPQLEARDRGESVHVAVAAASIVAKVRRDELFARIARRYAVLLDLPETPRGGGYMNDATRMLVRRYIAHTRRLPPEGRHSWPWEFCADLLPASARPRKKQPSLPGLERLDLKINGAPATADSTAG